MCMGGCNYRPGKWMGDNVLISRPAKEGKWVLIIMIMAGSEDTRKWGSFRYFSDWHCHGTWHFRGGAPAPDWCSFKRILANAENFKGII